MTNVHSERSKKAKKNFKSELRYKILRYFYLMVDELNLFHSDIRKKILRVSGDSTMSL